MRDWDFESAAVHPVVFHSRTIWQSIQNLFGAMNGNVVGPITNNIPR